MGARRLPGPGRARPGTGRIRSRRRRPTGTHPDVDALREQPVGHTHALLLELRQRLWGPALEAVADCPACTARVEIALSTTDLLAPKPGRPESVVVHGDHVVTWRSPTPADLLAVTGGAADRAPGRAAALAARCLTVSTVDGYAATPDELPAEVWPLLDEVLVDADPLAELVAAVTCPDCGTAFEADLDPGAFVWAELEARAHRLLHEIDVLARGYGWTQPDVLALGERRRAAYVSLVLEGVP